MDSKAPGGHCELIMGRKFKKTHLERQVSYFFKATLPLKPATIALKIGHLAFQAP